MAHTWTINDSSQLYQINNWGLGYFLIDEKGFLNASPLKNNSQLIPILDIITEAQKRGLKLPLKIRFQDILKHRIQSLVNSFQQSIKDLDYHSEYRGVFPVKVNQFYEVIDEILKSGQKYYFGIEAGSKAELITAITMQSQARSLIICNGYKDRAFIKHALNARKLDKNIIIIVEKLEEVRLIIEMAKKLSVVPMIGFRSRLSTESSGKWSTSGGENAKFGLTTYEIIQAITLLKKANLVQAIKLLHFHIGSQIPDIRIIGQAVREGTRFYTKLVKIGIPLVYLDIGGGLGVDYDGSKSISSSSANYTLQEYTNNVIYNVRDICEQEAVAHPVLISESGRAIAAHHCLIVSECIGSIKKNRYSFEQLKIKKKHKLIQSMLDIKKNLDKYSPRESFHDLEQDKEEAVTLFRLGYMDLKTKAMIESLYWEIAGLILNQFQQSNFIPEEIKKIENYFSEQYILNLSVFQSIPDYWAINQLFPVLPILYLEQKPEVKATLVDITCDSDGKIDRFINRMENNEKILLHQLSECHPYYIGIFLTGAYQDTMGNFHNLFGKINEVHVYLDEHEEQGWYIENMIHGDSLLDVLEEKYYSKSDIIKNLRRQVEKAIKTKVVKPNEGMQILSEFENALTDYTYLQNS